MPARLTAILAATLLLAASATAQTPLASLTNAADLMRLAGCRTMRGAYTQTRHIQALDLDFTITGTMALERDGRLLWRAEKPIEYACVMTKDKLVQWDGETKKVLEVSARKFPWLRLLYDCQAAWVSGDIAALARIFQLSFRNHGLLLVPLATDARELFRTMEITFAPDYSRVASVLLHETSGDTLRIEFHDVILNQPLPEETWQIPPK